MKMMKKLFAIALVAAIVLSLGVTAMAQTVGTAADGKGSITVQNAAKGQTYKVFKLFDATVGNGGIAYTGTIPDPLKDYFTEDSAGDSLKATGKSDEEIAAAVQAWGAKATGAVAEAKSDGSVLTFQGLDYGYYAVTSDQGAVVTVDSTTPNATIYDKNTTTVVVDSKATDKQSYSIGDTITYTATFSTANFLGEGVNSKQVTKYVISDTLPEFLSDVTVTSITVGGTAIATQSFDTNKQITIPWVNANGDSLYANGAKLVITYTAKLTKVVNVNGANINTITIQPYVKTTTGDEPWSENWSKDKEITTYAAALKKVDAKTKESLTGAQFTVKGLTVTGSNGVYTVVSYNPAANAAESAALDTDANGMLYIIGLANDVELTVTESKAPAGYNKLTAPFTLKPQVLEKTIYAESGTINYDAKDNVVSSSSTSTTTRTVERNLSELNAAAAVVDNNKGTELPSTGGIGTKIFYGVGAVLVIGAGVVLMGRKRAAD